MPKCARELSAAEVRRIKAPGLHAVGGVPGLCLKVGGGRSWILRTRISGKRRHIGLGSYPAVTLSAARDRARDIEVKIFSGRDPIAERQALQIALKAEQIRRLPFFDAARQCYAARVNTFRNKKYRKDWIASLERYAFPMLGEMPVADIGLPEVLAVIKPIWYTRTETATRVRQRMESVLSWAIVSGYRQGNNPARWEGNLSEVLPAPGKIKKVSHYRALPWREVPAFMAALRKRQGMAALALEFAILTAARSGEVRGALWDEIDTKARLWTVPGERIKAGKIHRVPLSQAALAVLSRIPRTEDNPLIFPAPRGGKLSDMTLSAVCKRMNVEATPHGFRSSFKDWARSVTAYADEISELALAHVNSDATRAAYARDELLPQRARLMTDWAKFCQEGLPDSASITPIGASEVWPSRS